MQLVAEYKLLASDSRSNLESHVNQAIHDGWVPSGTAIHYGGELVQAMLKFDETGRA